MLQSENINELATALSKAQGEFGHVLKNKQVNFSNTKYSYADLAGCFDACREALSNNGLSIVQPTQLIGTSWVVITRLMHSSGQWIDSILPISLEGRPQDVGSRITYMRKYQLWSILGLATEDDDGQSEARHKFDEEQKNINMQNQNKNNTAAVQEIPKPIERINKAEIIALTSLTEKLDKDSNKTFLDWIKKTFNADSIQDIPRSSFEKCLISINARIKYLHDQEKSMAVA